MEVEVEAEQDTGRVDDVVSGRDEKTNRIEDDA